MGFGTSNVGKDKYTGFSYEGKPITLTKKRGPPVKQERHNVKWWPEETRIEAATLWAATRDIKTVSALTKVPAARIKEWQREPWWENVITRVVKDKNDVLDTHLTDIIHKCAEQIQDRLLAGDPRVNYKTGQVYTVPLDARGLAMVMGILFDKRQLVRGEATSRTETVSTDKRLAELQQAFIQFSKATQIEGKRVDEPIQQEEPRQGEDAGQNETLLIEDHQSPPGESPHVLDVTHDEVVGNE